MTTTTDTTTTTTPEAGTLAPPPAWLPVAAGALTLVMWASAILYYVVAQAETLTVS